MIPNHVILLKNKTVPVDDYQVVLTSNQINSTFVPLLRHEHLNKDDIVDFLGSDYFINQSKSLIVTSQRAVEVLNECMTLLDAKDQALAQKVFNKPAYTVGPATAKILSKAGFTDIRGGSNAGNGDILADIIIDDELYSQLNNDNDKKITFFTGEIRKDIIPKKLIKNGFQLIEKIVYKTSNMPDIIENYMKAMDQLDLQLTNWIVFFSPQGTEKIVDHLVKLLNDDQLKNIKIASIGPTTEIYLKEKGLIPDIVAKKPHAESLFETMSNYVN